MTLYRILIPIISLFLFILVVIPGGVIAEELSSDETDDATPAEPVSNEGPELLYNGSIDVEKTVSIVAASGSSYTIPGNTPLGVLQSLAQSGAISKFSVGDELMKKKGVLLLDSIENLSSDADNGWFVKVNGVRLEDVVLSEIQGLNTYPLTEGNVVLFDLGTPAGMVSESKAYLTVSVGEIRTPAPEPELTNETEISEPEPGDVENSLQTNASTEQIDSDIKTDEEESASEETPKDDTPSSGTPTSGEQENLYSGTFSLPSGTVTIPTTGGEYDIQAATPLGLLQKLKEDGKISNLLVSDRGMKKGGILVLEGINDYSFSGDKTWFVVVNDLLLKDYLNPDTEGLNIYKIKAGDEVGFFFGEPSKPSEDADVSMIISIE